MGFVMRYDKNFLRRSAERALVEMNLETICKRVYSQYMTERNKSVV